MTQFMVVLKIHPEADVNQVLQITKGLGMQATKRSLDQVKVLVFEGSTQEFYRMKARLESGKFDDYFTLLDLGQATSFELEALSDEKASNSQKTWSILDWLHSGVPEVAKLLDNWQVRSLDFGTAMGGKSSQNIIAKTLKIAGQDYELKIIPRPEDGANRYFFELHSAVPGGRIPGGMKLRLLTEDMEGWQNNEDEAAEAKNFLRVPVEVEPGDGIIWQTDPLPENYYPEPLWF